MKGDFSRVTFAEERHYRRVLMQQGRVQVDADGNEQIAIDQHLAATTAIDVVGAAGYPVGTAADGKPLGGFALGLTEGGTDLTISPGRMYVDGLLVENSSPAATILDQPDLPGATLGGVGAGKSGIYAVYLEAWERLITALDDPHIRESALGGPDTSVRTTVAWQVKLAFLSTADVGTQLPTCGSAGQPWLSGATTGTLAAGSGAPTEALPCMLPPDAGYQRLENQLYRVEIHASGSDGTATFKWSRENGCVVAAIVAPPSSGATPPATVSGPTFSVASLSDDPSLGLKAGDWVELTDDSAELLEGHGSLYQVVTTPTDGRTVTLDAPGAATVTLGLHPKLRRWDQLGAGLDEGVPVTAGTPLPLEGGVQVTFSAGTYRSGDYWLIPARTATSIQQGFLDWPLDATGQSLSLPPAGVERHFANLGLVEFTSSGTLAGLGVAVAPTDCRLPFTPLTGLTPAQSLSPCTIVVAPGPGWEQPILSLFQRSPEAGPVDAEICFPVGDFPVTDPVVITGGGHVRISGSGWGSRLVAAGSTESVLHFDSCLSVAVRDLFASTAQVAGTRTGAGRDHVNGTLTFTNCGDVTVQDVWLRCGSAVSTRGASCITVASDPTATNVTTGAGIARIRGCRLEVGEMQVGVQLTHQARATVVDNDIAVDPSIPATSLGLRLADNGYRAIARSYLLSQLTVAPAPAPPAPAPPAPTPPTPGPAGLATAEATLTVRLPPGAVQEPASAASGTAGAQAAEAAATPSASSGEVHPVEVPVGTDVLSATTATLHKADIELHVGNQVLSASTDQALASTWTAYLAANAPQTFATPTDAIRYVKSAANTILTMPASRVGYSAFSGVLRALSSHVPLAARGIVVGGQAIGDLLISENSISGVLMGISVGVSHRATASETTNKQRTPDHMQTIRIAANTIVCGANDVAARKARFGIFVGSADSLSIEGNHVSVSAAGIGSPPPADAIRVVGYLGAKAVIRANHTAAFAMGIRVVVLLGNGPGQRAAAPPGAEYLSPIRNGSLWLVADNVIQGASQSPPLGPFTPTKKRNPQQPTAPYIDAAACLLVDNVVAF